MEKALFSRQHVACAPELLRLDSSLLQGRILDSTSAALLATLGEISEEAQGMLEVHDVGRLSGRLRAARCGVRDIPAVVIDGEKHVGLAAARKALSDLLAARTDAREALELA
jgi:hypothetical protein